MADKIILKGIEVQGRHGCSAEERSQLQPFIVDVEMHLNLKQASRSDDLGDTIDYVQVLSAVRKIVGERSRNLIETVAHEIADYLLRRYMLLEGVKITLAKPNPPVKEKFAGASVEIFRHR